MLAINPFALLRRCNVPAASWKKNMYHLTVGDYIKQVWRSFIPNIAKFTSYCLPYTGVARGVNFLIINYVPADLGR